MKIVMLEDLRPGMILAEPVIGNFDLLYANSDEVITEAMLHGLFRLNIPYVYIQDKDTDDLEVTDYNDVTTDLIEAKENYQEMLNIMTHIFDDFHFLDKQVIERIEKPMSDLIQSISLNTSLLLKLKKLYLRDEYSLTHSVHVCLLSSLIAKWNGFRPDDIIAIGLAGLFHDLGKCKIPKDILNKPGKLSDLEADIMRRHSMLGYEIAKSQSVFDTSVLRGIIEHHERMDGNGYPQGLKKDQIHPFAQIIAIADVYDAMTTQRSYKNSESPFVAVEVIKDLSYKQHLNTSLVNRFLKNIYRLYIGAEVILSNGCTGIIVYINKFSPERPLIKLEDGFIDLYTTPDVYISRFRVS